MVGEDSMGLGIGETLRYQYSNLPITLTAADCAGKTYIITGSNSGLGYECTKHLLRLGAGRVIMAVRSLDRGGAALKAIEADTGKKGVAQVWQLDLGSYESVTKFADRVERDLDRVDGVVQNAAGANGQWIVQEGWESSIVTNVISTLFLTVLLIPHLGRCGKKYGTTPVISIVTSGLGFSRKADLAKITRSAGVLADVNDSSKWSMDGVDRYSLSKMLQIFATRRLTELAPVSRTGVIINYLNPGLANTGLDRYAATGSKIAIGILRTMMGRTAEWGSRNLLHGLSVGKESHGKFLSYCVVNDKWVPDWMKNEEGRKWELAIWNEVADEMERIRPGCVNKATETGTMTQ